MKLFIDALNIRGGGGITHLKEILNVVDFNCHDISKIYLCAFEDKINAFPNRCRLIKLPIHRMHHHTATRLYWQQVKLKALIEEKKPDVLFLPGGILPKSLLIPTVVMSQNLQPFDRLAMQKYKEMPLLRQLKMQIRYFLLRHFQIQAFKKSNGIIFLTEHGKRIVLEETGPLGGKQAVVSHGINAKFFGTLRKQHNIEQYSDDHPFRFIYVSTINLYKHQWNVAKAIQILREKGFPVAVDFIGPAVAGLQRLKKVIRTAGPHRPFIRYLGTIPYDELEKNYHCANAFIFASTCETFGQVLIEALASGLPVASSAHQPMKEILGRTAVYFNPTDVNDIVHVLGKLLQKRALRTALSEEGHKKASAFSWDQCAKKTFSFIEDVCASANLKSNPKLS